MDELTTAASRTSGSVLRVVSSVFCILDFGYSSTLIKWNRDAILIKLRMRETRMEYMLSAVRKDELKIMKELKDYVITIPDYPKKGIMFRDITSILDDADGLHLAIDQLQALLDGVDFDVIVGTESRGFIFGMPIAYNLHKPFVLVRKKGKLPRETISETYDLEYGTATVEIHKDSIKPGQKVVLVDDLIATGGTIEAAAKLVERLGGEVVKMIFVMELEGLKGRERLSRYDIGSVIKYPGA